MTNSQIADVFELMADLLEFQGENPFRVRAYRNGARAIRNLADSVAAIVQDDPKRLQQVEGIGKAVADKCQVLVQTGELPQLKKLQEEIPETVLSIMRIPGMGPKKTAAVYHELGIATLDELRTACQQGRIQAIKGFGKKTEDTILSGIDMAAVADQRIYWAKADEVVGQLRQHLEELNGIQQLEFAGSYRRGRETVGDLDVLVVAAKADQVMDHFARFSGSPNVMARGDTKMSIRIASGLQIDLRIVPPESFGAALQYFTGSKEHNVVLRTRAKQRGLKINEYGVYRIEGERETYVAGQTEQEVYATLDLPWFPPELREARREFDWAKAGELPELIRLEDIQGELHAHTNETDGQVSLEAMAQAAQERGLKYLAITDHSKRVSMAGGLDEKRLLDQWQRIDRWNERAAGEFRLLKGIECDILEKGGLDLADDVLAQADWVLASIHYGQRQPRQQITARILEAVQHPHVSAIAHPTGRLINQRPAYDVDLDAVFAAARQHGKLLELNANPMRLDLDDVFCAAAKSHGIPIVINTDAHSIENLDLMRYGILQARRAGLTKADVANSRTWPELKKLIGGKRREQRRK